MRGGVLAKRDFRLIVGSVFLTALGDWAAIVVLMLKIQEMGSSWGLAAFLVASWLPLALLAPLSGLAVDRLETTRLLAWVSLGQAAIAAGLAFVDPLAAILVLVALLGIGASVSQPAEFALIPAIAGDEHLTQANGYVETSRYLGMALGPLLGGFLAAAGGTEAALLVNAASFVAVTVAALMLRVRRRPDPVATAGSTSEHAREGYKHLFGDPLLRLLTVVVTISLVFMSVTAVAEVFFIKDDLGAGDVGFGITYTTWLVGMALGSLVMARRFRTALAAGALGATVVQGLGLAAGPALATLGATIAGFFVGGIGHGLKNVLSRTIIQVRVPDRVHGRAFAAYNALRNSAELGALAVGGTLVATIGARSSMLLAGLTSATAGFIGLLVYQRLPARERAADVPAEKVAPQPLPGSAAVSPAGD